MTRRALFLCLVALVNELGVGYAVAKDGVTPPDEGKPTPAQRENDEMTASQGEAVATQGDILMHDGKIDQALNVYINGWTRYKNSRALKGLATIYVLRKNLQGVKTYIEPITERAGSDIDFLRYAMGYSLQVEDVGLFRRCLSLTKPEWLQADDGLRKGISRGAIMFFSDPPQVREDDKTKK